MYTLNRDCKVGYTKLYKQQNSNYTRKRYTFFQNQTPKKDDSIILFKSYNNRYIYEQVLGYRDLKIWYLAEIGTLVLALLTETFSKLFKTPVVWFPYQEKKY